MSLGRLIPVVSAVLFGGGVALAQPKTPPAGGAPAAPAAGEGSGSAVAPIEDSPPADMEGTSEDPDAPKGTGDETPVTPTGPTPAKTKSGYPTEESQRPITLPQNMAEVSLAPHFMVSPYVGGDTLRARYGITPQIQLGLNYVFAGIYAKDVSNLDGPKKFHVGKTGGVDLTVLITNWLGVKAGVPVYFDPVAVSFAAGAPIKFIFDKFAIGGLDDLLNIRIAKFAPRYDYELFNEANAAGVDSGTETSRGYLRFSGYGVYQQDPKLAILGRFGIESNLGSGGGSSGGGASSPSETITFIRAGVQYTPRRFIDVGAMLGFEDLSDAGSFGLTAILALRI